MKFFLSLLSLNRIFGIAAIILTYISNHINCVNVIDGAYGFSSYYVNVSKVIACIIVFIIAQVLAWVGLCIKKENNKIFNYISLVYTYFLFTLWAGFISNCGPMPYIV